jgi:hypothetical protein
MKLRERDIQKTVCDWLTLRGFFWYRQNVGGAKFGAQWVKFGLKGLPDVVVIVSGIYVGLEFKRPGGFLSEAQEFCKQLIKNAGAEYVEVKSLEDAQRVIADVLARLREVTPD